MKIAKKFKANKKLVSIVLISCLFDVALSPLRGYVSLMASTVVGFAVYFIFTAVVIKKYTYAFKPTHLLLAVILGCSIFPVPAHTLYFNSSLSSLPDYIMHLLGILAGYWFILSNRKYVKTTIVMLSIILCVFVYFKGYFMWIHNLNFGTFTGLVTDTPPTSEIAFLTIQGDTVTLESFKGRYLVLDCWYTYCGVCYKKFPEVQVFYDRYKKHPEVTFYAVHSRMVNRKRAEESISAGNTILLEKGYTFPCLSIDIDNPVLQELGVNRYPTVLIFNKTSELIFKGNMENASQYIADILN